MPKVHNIGSKWFTQILTNYKAEWGWRIAVRGWTQEIEEPYRTASPLIVRLPPDKAIVLGRWNGLLDEEEALDKALQRRDLSDDDFQEENGWTPAPDEDSEEGSDYLYT